ncbi:hypothetical protein ACFFIG_08435, partial [Paraburkholderia rhizosphaerae]|uniref:hypothetical protein n=1 Tax=Paraburkholderia rhizosphaerae TaxID=480658 RepID=UPI0035F0B16A
HERHELRFFKPTSTHKIPDTSCPRTVPVAMSRTADRNGQRCTGNGGGGVPIPRSSVTASTAVA